LSLIAQRETHWVQQAFAAAESLAERFLCDEAIADARAWLEQGL
jgi:hypothetical protein